MIKVNTIVHTNCIQSGVWNLNLNLTIVHIKYVHLCLYEIGLSMLINETEPLMDQRQLINCSP